MSEITSYAANLTEYATKEMKLTNINIATQKTVLAVMQFIDDNDLQIELEGSVAVDIIKRLVNFKPLSPLTGEPKEWGTPDESGISQNLRCPSVLKCNDGSIIDIDGGIVSADGGMTWDDDLTDISDEFPYYPPTEPKQKYIERTKSGKIIDITNSPTRIVALWITNFERRNS